jgi:NADH-quinone oxidoreductase subunit M
MLNLLIWLPIVAAIAIAFGAPPRRTAVATTGLNLLVALALLFGYDKGVGGFQFIFSRAIVPAWDLKYLLAADGLSIVMLLLTAVVAFAAIWVTPVVAKREGLFFSSLLLIAAGAAGAFASQDLLFFYAFHELALIPTFLLIGIWGHGERHTAAWKITIYLALGSFVLLIGLLDLYNALPAAVRTFDMIKLQQLATQQVIPATAQYRPYLLLLIGFGILVSLFPFHSWAPQAYAAAPSPAAMLHAGVLKKFGLYGLIRLTIPLLPAGAQNWAWLLLILLVGNIIYIGLATIGQTRLDLMLGYSSVMHMGYIFLGIAALNSVGVAGAALLMFAHGLSIAALFAIAGQLRARNENLSLRNFGGLGKTMPFLGAAFGCAAFASIGLPGFANFASELMVFFGAFRPGVDPGLTDSYRTATAFALWGVVISAVYMLRAYRAIFMGPVNVSASSWTDPVMKLRPAFILLLALLLIAGFFPGAFLQYLKPSVEAVLAR